MIISISAFPLLRIKTEKCSKIFFLAHLETKCENDQCKPIEFFNINMILKSHLLLAIISYKSSF